MGKDDDVVEEMDVDCEFVHLQSLSPNVHCPQAQSISMKELM